MNAVMTTESLDLSDLLLHAYDIGDSIISSSDVQEYLYWKQAAENDEQVISLSKLLAKKKELWDECQRFGRFHPDYHAAKEAAEHVQQQMDELEVVRRFKLAEQRLDELLYTVSETIAYSVSETIKVPSNNPLPSSGCGGNCSSCG
ncbi:MAG: hypothetical protein K0R75_84 [Paenibacillaceae bacterium]|jgi:cell fate (sporulation/competence/biofilm development) regulator YlbF (YheA/YmcA/DUF963 family)|nr:hypothetical protein [Paenibacillaceae bacterium]